MGARGSIREGVDGLKSQARVCQVANVCILDQIAFDFRLALPFGYLCMPSGICHNSFFIFLLFFYDEF